MSLKRTKLYRDDTGEIFTFHEIKVEFTKLYNLEEESASEEVEEFIFENLVQNGGNIEVLTDENDEVLKWCNDYAKFMEADRHLSQGEKDKSVKEIYCMVNGCDNLDSVISNLVDGTKDGQQLYDRLIKIREDIVYGIWTGLVWIVKENPDGEEIFENMLCCQDIHLRTVYESVLSECKSYKCAIALIFHEDSYEM